MHRWVSVFGAGLVFFAFAGTSAPAQTASPPAAASAATPAPIVPGKEDPAITADAKKFYAQLVAGKIDRSKMSDDINQKMPDPLLQTVSGQLSSLGQGEWHYLGTSQRKTGVVSVYDIAYSAITLQYIFGEKDGKVWAFFVGPKS